MSYSITRKFNYTQSTPSDIWTITYPFTGTPVIDVLVNINGTMTKMVPQTTKILSPSSVQLTFTQAFAGIARIVS